jgi:hypothetical protein
MANPRPFTKPADRIYPVFEFGASLRGEPAYTVNRDTRDEMLADYRAHSVNGGKALQLNRKLLSWRGSSCKPSRDLIERALDGSLVASVACESWAGEVLSAEKLKAQEPTLYRNGTQAKSPLRTGLL